MANAPGASNVNYRAVVRVLCDIGVDKNLQDMQVRIANLASLSETAIGLARSDCPCCVHVILTLAWSNASLQEASMD